MPLNRTILKIEAPILLLRNLDPPGGLYNGTRLIVITLGEHVIENKILTNTHAGKAAFNIDRKHPSSSDTKSTRVIRPPTRHQVIPSQQHGYYRQTGPNRTTRTIRTTGTTGTTNITRSISPTKDEDAQSTQSPHL